MPLSKGYQQCAADPYGLCILYNFASVLSNCWYYNTLRRLSQWKFIILQKFRVLFYKIWKIRAKNSDFYVRICVLPVPCGVFAVLNGKFGAAVQTAEAHNALFHDPDRLSAFHFYCSDGAFFLAKTAPDTAALNAQVWGLARLWAVKGLGEQSRRKSGSSRRHMSVFKMNCDFRYHVRNLTFGRFCKYSRFFGRGKVENRRFPNSIRAACSKLH